VASQHVVIVHGRALIDGPLAYRTAHQTFPPLAYHSSPMRIYHSLNPHPALSPFPDPKKPESCRYQAQNEAVYRQLLVQGALAVLLPTEDLQNAALRTLVSDIIADLILGQNISAKACEGWFLHETCIKIVEVIKARIEPKAQGKEIEHDTRSRLDKFGLLSPKVGDPPSHLSDNDQSLILALFWRMLQHAYLVFLVIRFVVVGLFRARSLPSRGNSLPSAPPSPITKRGGDPPTPSQSCSALPSPPPRPMLDYRLFALLSTLLDLSACMPWQTGLLSLCKHGLLTGPGQLGAADSLLQR
jgi:PXA domain